MLAPARASCGAAVALLLAGAGVVAGSEATELQAFLLARQGIELKEVATVTFATTHDGWRASGLEISAGESVTLFASGTDLETAFGRPTAPHRVLWVRVGEGEVFNLGGDAYSFVATEDGELAIAVRPPGVRWLDCSGRLPPEIDEAAGAELDLAVVVAIWKAPLQSALEALAGNRAVESALADHRSRPTPPAGFRSLCHLQTSRAFHAWEEGERRGVRGLAAGEAGIIKKPIDLPLDDETEITFEWRYDTLPAKGPETDARYHDYSSIAVEFDNGQDITWMWAGHVPAGTTFRCPLRWWDQRETHIVLSSGPERLGTWQTHTRRIAEDYDRAVGGQRPSRIVGVWFISVGAFGDTTADATYANVQLRSAGRRIDLFE